MDGLESASAGRVCLAITAMDATTLPPALLRSGRVELWLSTRLPDARARETILRERLGALPSAFPAANVEMLACNRHAWPYAHAVATGGELAPLERFFLRAIETRLANQRSYGRWRALPFGGKNYRFPLTP